MEHLELGAIVLTIVSLGGAVVAKIGSNKVSKDVCKTLHMSQDLRIGELFQTDDKIEKKLDKFDDKLDKLKDMLIDNNKETQTILINSRFLGGNKSKYYWSMIKNIC